MKPLLLIFSNLLQQPCQRIHSILRVKDQIVSCNPNLADDSVQCLGSNYSPYFGTTAYGQTSVPSGLGSVKSIAAANCYTCAIKADDFLECWGSDSGACHRTWIC